jgi:hypothetical protein
VAANSPAFLSFVKGLFGSDSSKITSISDQGTKDYVNVVSTCLSDVAYDTATNILTVTFVESGATYDYFGVNESDYETLVQSGSVGGTYNAIIKYDYAYLRI